MAYKPLHHKYRPQTFADLVGQEAIAQTLTNAIHTERIAPAYLFTGPRGTGKTSSARIFAKSLNCLSHDHPTPSPCGTCDVCIGITKGSTLDVIEIDAASNTGVDNIRELIERSQFAPVQCRYKVYVVDEVHMLSVSAFNALLKTLEEPPNRVVFILATTDPQRVLPTIISRCQRFDFRRIPLEAMVGHLQKIATEEKIEITTEAVQMIAQIAQGGLRDAESLLDQLSLLAGEITVERVWDLVGAVPERDLMLLLEAIASDNSTEVLECTRQIMDRGREPIIVLQNLAGFYRDLLIAKTAPTNANLVALTKPTWEQLCQVSQTWDIRTILAGQKHLQTSEVQIKNTTQPRLWLEVTLLGLLPAALASSRVIVEQLPQRQTSQNISVQSTSKSSSQPQAKSPIYSPPKQKISEVKEIPTASKNEENLVPSEAVNVNPKEVDLQEIWQRVLAEVKLSTQQLLLQPQPQVILLGFNNQVARIGVSSDKWQKMVMSKVANIEAGFEKVFKTAVKVKVEVTNTKGKNQSVSENLYPNNSKRERNITNHEKHQETSNSDDEVIEDEPETIQKSNTIKSDRENRSMPDISLFQPQLDNVAKQEKYPEKERQTVAVATRRIADFFQGEIVDIELIKSADKTDLSAASESSQLSVNSQIFESEDSNIGIDEPEKNEDLELDDDIIF
ncbi:MAG: DNA polymerase III subunit gamma/tau [Okeania sp. SIO2G4]|uniref:DNA polymerase III subunit gamma/tau n=1 Tax=unclassified Okeania TaxID=2634635 RepID=UPI0013B5C790|nr:MULTISPECIES: DNA polymerase III subunit gamma/tau [unclassified Okeania]NEP73395.1 DNA polymerase III subunit gamma/tau [Okeania sp. SIO2G5]NEP94944.1 DNA polymerase III subunit gamma/tau [Okeania sp. SIO2F5]NEQ92034.1 DNA polymerase III subunit gamma/tau [Okeania sp. SIO2G4]